MNGNVPALPHVVIIGAGPAGLTAARELLRAGGFRLTILEATDQIGGISKTINYKGNRIDIGGHRFFSKSDWVMDWWQSEMPVHDTTDGAHGLVISYHNASRSMTVPEGANANDPLKSMLIRNRLSRIFFEGKFFAYPVKADFDTARKLGFIRLFRVGMTYIWARLFPRKPETTLEDFMINRFGTELYNTFFKEYTEKVWGKSCNEIAADWGAQRIKGLSITRALATALKRLVQSGKADLRDKNVETSLIERFLYPALGPGQMWETVAARVTEMGAALRMNVKAAGMNHADGRVTGVNIVDGSTGKTETLAADYVISTMPVRDLVTGLNPPAPEDVRRVASGLEYRDFITVGLLLKKLSRTPGMIEGSEINLVPDNWIYIQDRGVTVGRLQVFNNWSPYMVADGNTAWIGMEFFCQEGDPLWASEDASLVALGIKELEKIGLADAADVLDHVVIRQPKAYPGYYGTYSEFDKVRAFADTLDNLFLIGRNGMHRYNNQDHSMLTAKLAAEAIAGGVTDKSALWDVNAEEEYHEEKKS